MPCDPHSRTLYLIKITMSLELLRQRLNQSVLGSEAAAELLLVALLARGHVLIEGVPGLGKTLLHHGAGFGQGFTHGRADAFAVA